jgi:hypothetical protein
MMTEHWVRRVDWLVLLAVLCAVPGCGGSGSSAKGVIEYRRVRAMTDLYTGYLGEHRGQPPANEQAFRQYLATKQDDLERSELTIDQMFMSPRETGPLVWVYGMLPPSGPMGTYYGYEQTPVDGKRLVIANLGMYELVDDARFHATFPNAK